MEAFSHLLKSPASSTLCSRTSATNRSSLRISCAACASFTALTKMFH